MGVLERLMENRHRFNVQRQHRRKQGNQPELSPGQHRSQAQPQERADEHQVAVISHEINSRRRPADHHQFEKQRHERKREEPRAGKALGGRCAIAVHGRDYNGGG